MSEKMKYFFYGAPLNVRVNTDALLQERLQITGNNTGNLFIAYTVERHLGTPNEAVLIGHEVDVDRINGEYDKVIIPASNFVNSYSDMGAVAKIIRKLKIPVVVIGIGSQASKYTDRIELKKGTIEFLEALSEKSVTLGARGNFTAEKLFDIGIRNVDVIGCPTIYFNSSPDFKLYKKPFSDVSKVAVNFGRRRENLHLLNIAIKEHLPFFAQSELLELSVMEGKADHKDIAKDPLYKRSSLVDPIKLEKYLKSYGRVFYNIPDWIIEISSFDFILGPRLHGNMIGFQNGIPALWFVHDTRTGEICDLAKLPSISISDIEKIKSLDEYYSLVDIDSFNKNYPALYNNYIDFLERNQLVHNLTRAITPKEEMWSQLYSFDIYQRKKTSNDDTVASSSRYFERPTVSWNVQEKNGFRDTIKLRLRMLPKYLKIHSHPIFDREWYFEKYLKNTKFALDDSLWHYLRVGWKLGNNPGSLFDVSWYRKKNPDVAEAEVEPLSHYIFNGWREGRSPSPLFDISWYRRNYPEVAKLKMDPFLYYLKKGWRLGHNPNPFFNVKWYLSTYPGVDGEPLENYIKFGWKVGRNPSPGFDAQAYLKRYPDVQSSGMEPLTHYLKHGKREKRSI
jgi:hypothetical protein